MITVNTDLGYFLCAGFPGDDERPHSEDTDHDPAACRRNHQLEAVPHPDRHLCQPGEPQIQGGPPGDTERVVQEYQRVVLRAIRC